MIKYPIYSAPQHSDLDHALRLLIKFVVYLYLIISGALALIVGIVIVGMICAYLLLRTMIWVTALLLHKQVGFSLRDALLSLLDQTRRYAANQGAW